MRNLKICQRCAVLMGSVLAVLAGRAVADTISLGNTAGYAVFAGAEIYNTGNTTVGGGSVGAPAIIGFPPGTVSSPYIVTETADFSSPTGDLNTILVTDLNLPPTQTLSSLSNQTLTPGVYDITGGNVSGTLTLDDQGQTDPLFIFQFAGAMITSDNFSMTTINAGANSSPGSNVFFLAGSSAILGSDNSIEGHIFSGSYISLGYGTSVSNGSVLAGSLIDLDDNTIDDTLYTPAGSPVVVPLPASAAAGAGLLGGLAVITMIAKRKRIAAWA